jgi:hypothetical protein
MFTMKKPLIACAFGLSALCASTVFAAATPISLTQACSLGGTRVVKGSFDETSGAVDLSITLTGCAGRPSDKPIAVAVPAGAASGPTSASGHSEDDSRKTKPFMKGIPTHDGTIAVKGTFLNSKGVVTVNLVDQINTKVTFNAAAKTMTRVCTIARVGTLDATKDVFDGTVTHNNCTMTGSYHESFGLIEHLLRHTTDTQGH